MYWDTKGPDNTAATIDLAVQRSRELGIKYLVVASNTGATVECLLPQARDMKILCVTHQIGFKEPGDDEMGEKKRQELEEMGVQLLTTTHLMGGVGRAVRRDFGGLYPGEIMAQTLRILGHGLKVALEISVMALDAGCIPYGEEIMAIGGSSSGADTAAVISPEHSQDIFKSRIREIVCMPR